MYQQQRSMPSGAVYNVKNRNWKMSNALTFNDKYHTQASLSLSLSEGVLDLWILFFLIPSKIQEEAPEVWEGLPTFPKFLGVCKTM